MADAEEEFISFCFWWDCFFGFGFGFCFLVLYDRLLLCDLVRCFLADAEEKEEF